MFVAASVTTYLKYRMCGTHGIVGDVVGDVVGDAVGEVMGDVVGDVVGETVGDAVGDVVGEDVGDVDGDVVGDAVGAEVGHKTLEGGNVKTVAVESLGEPRATWVPVSDMETDAWSVLVYVCDPTTTNVAVAALKSYMFSDDGSDTVLVFLNTAIARRVPSHDSDSDVR